MNAMGGTISLNQGQQEAADGFFNFLLSTDKYLIISGGGGYGKTYVMKYLIDRVMPQYFSTCQLLGIQPEYDEVEMTATTNKAAEVLGVATGRPTRTIHSLLNLIVRDDYTTGRSKLARTSSWFVHTRKIIFIDESSMVDSALLQMLDEGTHKCKVVFVMDHCQAGPVGETITPVCQMGLPFYELTEPMRNAGQPDLVKLCQQLRNTVETGVFLPIQVVPGVIDWVDDQEMERLIDQTFQQQTRDSRILAYTNNRVTDYNDHIRGIRGLSSDYRIGEMLVNNQSIRLGKISLAGEEEVEIIDQEPNTETVTVGSHNGTRISLEVRRSTLRSRLGMVYHNIPLALDREYLNQIRSFYSKSKNWSKYFHLKETFPDLRPRDAATIHKAQGSTYDSVFIDLQNLSTCHLPQVFSRLLYVAASRARNRVILYGDLAPKYGVVQR